MFGSGDYAMRIWLNPEKIAERKMTADEVVSAVRRQNVQVAAGVINGPPYGSKGELQLPINAQGRLSDPDQFAEIVIKRDAGVVTYLKDVARVEVDASQYGLRSCSTTSRRWRFHFSGPRLQRHRHFQQCPCHHGGTETEFPARAGIPHRL